MNEIILEIVDKWEKVHRSMTRYQSDPDGDMMKITTNSIIQDVYDQLGDEGLIVLVSSSDEVYDYAVDLLGDEKCARIKDVHNMLWVI